MIGDLGLRFPGMGYTFMRNLNEEALVNDQFYSGGFRRASTTATATATACNGDAEPEMLKQTMLKHESIFRNQLQELHRVYGIQRCLMDELKSRDSLFSKHVEESKKKEQQVVNALPFFLPQAQTPSSINGNNNSSGGRASIDLNEPPDATASGGYLGNGGEITSSWLLKHKSNCHGSSQAFQTSLSIQTGDRHPDHQLRFGGDEAVTNGKKSVLGGTVVDNSMLEQYGTSCVEMKPEDRSMEEATFECLEKKGAPKVQMQIDLNSLPETLEIEQITLEIEQITSSPSSSFQNSEPAPAAVPASSVAMVTQNEETIATDQHIPAGVPDEDETTTRITAETIVALSSERSPPTAVKSRPSTSNPSDSLQWFADVIISNDRIYTEEVEEENHGEGDGDSIDFYESMTLKLTDTKSENSYYNRTQPRGHDNVNGKQTGLSSTLLTKTRKCQGKKRRQKRDFQKDILPGLSSLSRREVSEDLQTFGGLMRACGLSWQTSGTRRSSCRKGRRQRKCTDPVADPVVTSPEEAEGNVIGWGSTRRCRRQRWPSGYSPKKNIS